MGQESASYINDLVGTNPVSASDLVRYGAYHLRTVKNAVKNTFPGFAGAVMVRATETGTAAAHVLTPSTPLISYVVGTILLYRPVNAGTGALTVNVSALGAKDVKLINGADPSAGDVVANQPLMLMYDGTNMVIIGGSPYLMKTGAQTITGNTTITGTLNVSGDIGGVGGDKKANRAGETYSGTHDFSGATSVLVPTATLNGQAVNYAQLIATAFSAALPGQPGGSITYKLTSLAGTAGWSVDAPAVGASLYMATNFGSL